MRKSLFSLLLILLIPFITNAQKNESQYIEWTGEDEIANEMVIQGIGHLMNIEFEKSLTLFQAAVEKDPSLFAPHVELAFNTSGEKRDYHISEAKRLVKGKNEVSQLFVSQLDIERGPGAGDKFRSIWKKMAELAPDGRFVQYRYAMSIQDEAERIEALENLIKNNEKAGYESGHVHNILGYALYAKGDKEKAKMHFEKYLELRPKGYNAYDSMAEFYMNEGDYETSLKYYKKARNEFANATNANNKIKELETIIANKDLGELMLITTEYVMPEHTKDYMAWGKEYKEIAERTNFKNFFVSQSEGAYHYVVNVGKEIGGVDKYDKDWSKWIKDNPELDESYQKYKHTVHKTERQLWRHIPSHSYTSSYASELPNTYSRVYFANVKYGMDDEAMKVLADFKSTWESQDVKAGYQVYRNVFGEDPNCIAIVSSYPTIKDWIADDEDVQTKVDKEVLQQLYDRWSKVIIKGESQERFPLSSISHLNNEG